MVHIEESRCCWPNDRYLFIVELKQQLTLIFAETMNSTMDDSDKDPDYSESEESSDDGKYAFGV